MKTYDMEVQTNGKATVVAATKREAREKAMRGEFSALRLAPASPLVSTITERKPK